MTAVSGHAAGFLPWHLPTARHWLQNRERFAHAWLIHGLAGIGKRHFARAAAASLLCEAPVEGLACGQCAACTWIAKGTHPDLRLIRPDALTQQELIEAGEKPGNERPGAKKSTPAEEGTARKTTVSKEIRIDQLRALHDWFNTTTHRAGWRVAVLYPAQALNLICANALLKVLEEPPPHTIFLIVADAPDRLLPTLVSRCRRLPLPVPSRQAVLPWLHAQHLTQPQTWLDASGGAPLHALALSKEAQDACPGWLQQWAQSVIDTARNPVHQNPAHQNPDYLLLAEALEALPASTWLDSLQRFFIDLQFATHGLPPRYFPAIAQLTQALAVNGKGDEKDAGKPHHQQTLSHAAKWLNQQTRLATHPLNARLFAYKVLQTLGQACRGQFTPD